MIDKNRLEFYTGRPYPLGCSPTEQGFNFAVFSTHENTMTFILYTQDPHQPAFSVALDPTKNKSGMIWHLEIEGLPERFEYGYRSGKENNRSFSTEQASAEFVLNDPYAKSFSGGEIWGQRNIDSGIGNRYRSLYSEESFDWEEDRLLKLPLTELIIYELHVRGYTKHPSSAVHYPGTYAGLIEKIPYLQSLGINAVELLPITEFDETGIHRRNSPTGEPLLNFWGYDPLGYFAPKASYAAQPFESGPVREFKQLVKEMHKAGIEVILDMVFNHTGENSQIASTFSFRGLANTTYYITNPHSGHYIDFTGCGNTVNCNHPVVRNLILDALRYWVTEMHVDGFRFDLASILCRNEDGSVLKDPPVIEEIINDPVLSETKLIAEAWDAAGLYQVDTFPGGKRWATWNDRFRDTCRRYVRGDAGQIPDLATRIAGSADLYRPAGRSPFHSINYITVHDGFTLADLVSYKHKHNRMNGENNFSANYGHEGPVDDPVINAIRKKQMKNMAALLFISQGVPMMPAGDELGRTQSGNNNAYCQDNEMSWVDWDLVHINKDLLRFFRILIRFRKDHPSLRRASFFEDDKTTDKAIHWYDDTLNSPDWHAKSCSLAFHLLPFPGDTDLLVITNSDKNEKKFHLPELSDGKQWYLVMDTNQASPADIFEKGSERLLTNQDTYQTASHSTVLLLGK